MKIFQEHRQLQLERLKRFCRTLFGYKDLQTIPVEIILSNIRNACEVYAIYNMAATSFKKQVGSKDV